MNNVNVNKLDSSGKQTMKSRILTAIGLVAVVGTALVLGGWPWLIFVTIALLLAIYEFIHATGKTYKWYVYVICYVSTLAFYGWTILKSNTTELINNPDNFSFSISKYYDELSISLFASAMSLGAFLFISILHDNFDLHDVTYLFTMCFLVGIGFQGFLFVRFYPQHSAFMNFGFDSQDMSSSLFKYFKSALLFGFVVLCTCLNDVMAYFVGVFFGKHKINPRISPKKTYEGFIGGWILSSILTFIVFIIFSFSGFDLLPGILDLEHWFWVLLLCFVIPALGNLGDFSFSLIKRAYGTKDYSNLLAGHGGILDRTDSLIFSCIGVSMLLTCFELGWRMLG